MPRLAAVRRAAALAATAGLVLTAAGCGAGTEPATSSGTTAPGAGPTTAPAGGAAELPTFDPSSAVGTYAQGFPTDLLPVPESATLLASSARPASPGQTKGQQGKGQQGKAVPLTQVTLNLSSRHPAKKVVAQIRQPLLDQGFEQVEAPESSGLTAQTAFLRTSRSKGVEVQESLVVGVLDDGDRRLVSISGTVRTP